MGGVEIKKDEDGKSVLNLTFDDEEDTENWKRNINRDRTERVKIDRTRSGK